MTQEIRRKAREALLVPVFLSPTDHEAMVRLKNFAALVRADEREQCAKLVEGLFDDPNDFVLEFMVDAIRAGGNT